MKETNKRLEKKMSKSPDHGPQSPLGEKNFGRKISQEAIWGRSKENKDDGKMSLWLRRGIVHDGRVFVLFPSSHSCFPRDLGASLAGSRRPINACKSVVVTLSFLLSTY